MPKKYFKLFIISIYHNFYTYIYSYSKMNKVNNIMGSGIIFISAENIIGGIV